MFYKCQCYYAASLKSTNYGIYTCLIFPWWKIQKKVNNSSIKMTDYVYLTCDWLATIQLGFW